MGKKSNILWLMLGFATLNTLPATARDYEKMWKEVESFQKKDLPQSALKSVRTIFRKAMDHNDKGQMVKAYLYMLRMRSSLSIDSLQPDLKRLEAMTTASRDSVEKAVLHSLLGKLYAERQYGRYDTTPAISSVPEDMSEWTPDIYRGKARLHFTASLSNKTLLSHTSMKDYLPIVSKGTADTFLGNDLLHVIGQTAIDGLTNRKDSAVVRSFYDSMINYYAGEGNREAVVLVTLEKLNYDRQLSEDGGKAYREAVMRLIADNPQTETCAEAYIALADKDDLWSHKRAEQLAFVRKGLAAWPKYRRIEALKEIEMKLLSSDLWISESASRAFVPGKPFSLRFSWTNLRRATLEFYRVREGYTKDLESDFDKFTDAISQKKHTDFLQRYTDGRPAFIQTCDLKGKPYETNDSTISVPGLNAGIYVVRLVEGTEVNANNYDLLSVSGLRAIRENVLRNGKLCTELRIVDAISGKPVQEASIGLYDDENNEVCRLKANEEGLVRLTREKIFKYRILSPTDNFSFPEEVYAVSYYPAKETATHTVALYTDRNVYRPGQTVKVAGIAYSRSTDKAEVESGKKLTVRLTDANNKQIGEKEVTSNAYGSFSAEFVLPSSTLNGSFRLSTTAGSTVFRVEEYKRPTYEVTFENPATGYKAGDSLSIVGTARTYAGVPLQHAKVDYTIAVSRGYWHSLNDKLPEDISGTATTDKEGHFIVPLRLMRLPEKNDGSWWYNYNINARVLSAAGETQEASLTLPLSNRSRYINIEGINPDGKVLKETASGKAVIIRVNNLKKEPVACEGTYVLQSLKEGKIQDPGVSGKFTANKTSLAKKLEQLPSGSYRLIARVQDKGEVVTDTTDFVLYSEADVRPPVKTDFWHEVISREISDTYSSAPVFVSTRTPDGKHQYGWIRHDVENKKSAVIKVGSSLRDVHLYYRLYNGEACIEDRHIILNDSLLTFCYDYRPEYRKGLKAVFTFMKDGKLYTSTDLITVVEPDKRLSMAWETFRDKLVPGQKENWTMWIARDDRQPFDGAEVIASMYDAALDEIYKRPAWLALPRKIVYPYTYGGYPTVNGNSSWLRLAAYWPITQRFNYKPLTYSRLNTFPDCGVSGRFALYESVGVSSVKFKTRNALSEIVEVADRNKSIVAPMAAYATDKVSDMVEQSSTAPALFPRLTPRSNFNETAFFYPQLRTDEKGKVSIAFTLPDALTRWNFRALAHTKDMLTGVKDTTVTVSKDFMVQPNLPRYARGGDVVSFPANLTNLSNKAMSGTARMELLDPDTRKIIYAASQQFTLRPGNNYALNFKWQADDKYPAVICRIQAVSGKTSDGEQSYVAILSDREQITESIALAVNGNQTVTYDLRNLFQKNDSDAKNRRLTVEFTSNPIWYAIQALPTMAETREDDALSLSSAYYAESLAQNIVDRYPALKTVFQRWRQEGGSGESLWSNLQKNPELKTIVLNETPWVAEAESETERKQRLSTLFEVNSLTYKLDNTLSRLRDLQKTDGSWSWYKGMRSNEYITLSVAEQLARLEKMTGRKTAAHAMLEKALGYLTKEVGKRFADNKKNGRKYDTDPFVLRTYYLQALIGQLKTDDCVKFYLDSWERHPDEMTKENKARSVIVLNAAGRSTAADGCLKSLMEYTVHTPELGRYFDNTSFNNHYWEDQRIPTQTLVIEALKQSGDHAREITEMSQWLLKQKQTQAWATPVQSANSVYALLIGNSKQTLGQQASATITLNGKTVNSDKETAGLGYIHYIYSNGNAVAHPATLTITKTTPGVAWGGVYARYTLPLAKVVSTATANDSARQALSIRREFYIERVENGKTVRHQLNSVQAKVGDRLISRLIVKTDRDMEFVQIKDGRTACAEPAETTSGYRYNDRIGYYETTKDASTNYFCDRMDKGSYIFENASYIDRAGSYVSGTASVQCAYAPEFISRTESVKINVQ